MRYRRPHQMWAFTVASGRALLTQVKHIGSASDRRRAEARDTGGDARSLRRGGNVRGAGDSYFRTSWFRSCLIEWSSDSRRSGLKAGCAGNAARSAGSAMVV